MIDAVGLDCINDILFVECANCGRIFSYNDYDCCPECYCSRNYDIRHHTHEDQDEDD